MPSLRAPETVPATLADLLDEAAAALAAAEESPRLAAEVLLAHALAVPRSRLRARPETVPDADAAAAFRALLARRVAGEPVAYLTGEREFWSLPLRVSPAVLVPRPETETLVEAALRCGAATAPLAVLDLGTGSGAVALALAHERPNWRVTASDRSAAALAVARGNAAALDLPVELVEGDWFAAVAGRRFDLVVSNPPYVAAGDPHLAALRHEPRAALEAGPDGLAALRAIVRDAPEHLAAGGWLLLEHGADQGAAVRALLVASGLEGVGTTTDGAGRARVSAGRMRT